MKQAGGAVREAVFERLSAGLSIPVYSTLPENVRYPHCLINTISSSRISAKKCPRQQHIIPLNFYDKHTTSDVALSGYLNDASESITDVDSSVYAPLAVAGFEVTNQLIGTATDMPNTDNTFKRKDLEIEVWTREA